MLEAKKVVRQILLLYLTTTGVFLAIFFSLWYDKLYEELLIAKTTNLREIHRNVVINIVNSRFTPIKQSAQNIAQSSNLKFSIFQANKALFDNLDFDFLKAKPELRGRGIYDSKAFFVAPMSSSQYYLKYNIDNDSLEDIKNEGENPESLKILIQGNDLSEELFLIRTKVIICALFSLMFFAFIADFLVKISLKPLEDKIHILNRFIKDSTHELNTPLSVILMSIEQLEKNFEPSAKFSRIKLAAQTLSRVYSDLVFYNFPSTISNEQEKINLKDLILERLEFFKLFFEQKKIKIQLSLEEQSFININKAKFTKLLDNLLSNAVKYNKKNGIIYIKLTRNTLSIRDTGCGIASENLKNIFEYYTRFNQDQGGFGIGLSLVKKICDENNIKITCQSIPNQGTSFTLEWT